MNRRGVRVVGALIASLAGLLAVHPVAGQDREPAAAKPKRVPGAVLYKPGVLPDRIILTWKGDPATSQAVTWRTDTSVSTPVAQIAPAGDSSQFRANARTLPATSEPLESDLGEALYHSVNFEGLTPKTKYAYRVGDGTNWSEWFQFTTAAREPEPFSFVYVGDAQTQIKEHWSRVIRQALADAPKARFVLHAGDLINSRSDAEWGEWHAAAGWINGSVPSVPTPGNHEYAGAKVSPHWRPQFTLPENGPAGLEETVYFLDFQGVRFVSLNSNTRQEEQVPWLEKVLNANPNAWTVVTFHHPLYATAKGRDNERLRKLWQPVFDRHRVDLVLQGHDHAYGRSGLLSADGPGGTVYVVSVSGPKLYKLEQRDWMRKSAEGKQLYQVIRINGDTLYYEARTATGELFDIFELRKQPGRPNRLLEREELEAPPEAEPAGGSRGEVYVAVGVLVGLAGLLFGLAALRRARKT